MVCIFCGEADPFKLTMNTRMMRGKALSVDVCFSCRWREQEQAEVIEEQEEAMGMRDGRILQFEEGIFEER